MNIKFSIVITTKNRLSELKITLESLDHYLQRSDVELLICDDASIDGTQEFLKKNYSVDTLIFNKKSKGLIANRNTLNNRAQGEYIISLDDDLNFLSENSLEKIEQFFLNHLETVILSFRIFWNLEKPKSTETKEVFKRVKSYAGGAHVIKKSFWNSTPGYPGWFKFYGEEDFMSYYVFKQNKKIYYYPEVLTHHRVSLLRRKKHNDYRLRSRRSLRSGWYLYFLFYPLNEIPKRFLYTLWIQVQKKTFKGDIKATIGIIQALLDVIINLPRLIKHANRLSYQEFKEYQKLPETVLYWSPKEE